MHYICILRLVSLVHIYRVALDKRGIFFLLLKDNFCYTREEELDIKSIFYQIMRSGQRIANSITEYMRLLFSLTNKANINRWSIKLIR